MKPYISLLLIVCSLKSSYAQSSGQDTLVMSVERIDIIYDKPVVMSLQFKPENLLKLKTSEGQKLMSKNYVIQDSAIVMLTLTENGTANIDTVPFQDIDKIRGKVYRNADRKVAGAILALGGLPLMGLGYLMVVTSNNQLGTAVMMLPGVGLSAWGIQLIGARSFNTKDKWTLKTTLQQKL